MNRIKQYLLGREAGNIFKKIHSLKVPDGEIPTITKIPKKKMQIQKYVDSDIRIAGDEVALKLINDNLDKI